MKDEHQYILKIGDFIWNEISVVEQLTVTEEIIVCSIPVDHP